ncbi:hypothetical protein [Candidatus Galacturonibacter soehngenii]|uniref:Uncharacterized protein n=1 Tax=Candidatus Galacturonatibacter soehngenii TaxID=2307010 RepID=A0A7V7UBG9_9FIRM|nr:hypothetical protein [Candidatus Galacturonibacter soehngenii]KAB1437569.1 hypothetical protein F7O84_08150 [Candidatus Galacturonibacter soehngenii]
MKFYKLNDNENRGSVVRTEGRSQQRFIPGRGWVESGVMIKYFNSDSPYYDAYSEITEEEANKLISNM